MNKKINKSGQLEILKRLFPYLKAHRYWIALSVILAVITVFSTLYIPIITGDIIDEMLGPGKVNDRNIIKFLIQMLVVTGVTAISQWIMSVCNNKVTYRIVQELRENAFSKLQRLPLKYIDHHPHGEIVSRIIADVDQLADGLLMGFTQLFSGILTILGTLVFMLGTNLSITIVVVVITPLSFFAAGFIAKKTFLMFKLQSEIRAEQTGLIDEMIENQKVVQAFGQEMRIQEEFDEINERLRRASKNAVFYSSITNPVTRFVNGLVYAGVGIAGAFFVIKGSLSVGQLTCFLSYANQYTKPFNEISGVMTELQNALACAKRILQLIDEKAEIAEAKNAVCLEQPKGNISLDGVAFSYDKEKELIKNLNLAVSAGRKVAIVGPTGCGKTTVINLLMRFYDVDQGSINIERVDIRRLTRKSLRGSYGMVLQETWLKGATVKENIKMGNPDAADTEVLQAAKAAHAHSFIERMPNGYDSWINEDGGNLSAGQKQLLCIARVMLCLPPMLILDEATSSIDTRTEIKISEAFEHMMKGRTSFVVAHRLSTIQQADMILFMKDGKILEQGNHQELLLKNGAYAALYNSQFHR